MKFSAEIKYFNEYTQKMYTVILSGLFIIIENIIEYTW